MSRLIDADALEEKFQNEQRGVVKRNGYTNEGFFYDQVMFGIHFAPTVDAVEVVRCKDCINYHDEEGVGWCELNSKIYSSGEWDMWDADDFCSRGKRKEE